MASVGGWESSPVARTEILGSRPRRTRCASAQNPVLPQPSADAEHVAVRMAEVQFADAPGFVGRRESDDEALCERAGVKGVDFGGTLDPPAHPDAVGDIIA